MSVLFISFIQKALDGLVMYFQVTNGRGHWVGMLNENSGIRSRSLSRIDCSDWSTKYQSVVEPPMWVKTL